jgi:hypothetical protein
VSHVSLERLIEAYVDWLDEAGASGRNKLDLNAKSLDGIGDGTFEVDLERVQEKKGNDVGGAITTYGARTLFTHSNMTHSSNQPFFCTV